MTEPFFPALSALLALVIVALLYLWHRAARVLPGEYRIFGPPVALPPTAALAEDLYRTHRGARRMVDSSTMPSLELSGCDEGQRIGWTAVAKRVEGIVKGTAALLVLLLSAAPALMVLLGGCASQLTHDRQQLTEILQVQRAAVLRLQSGDSSCQGKIVGAAKQREVAVRQLAAYRDRRKIVEAQVSKAAAAADEAQDQLLLSAPAKTDGALFRVRAETAALRAQVQQLLEGC